jgi:GxxExxY protein
MVLILGEKTGLLRRGFFDVHNEVGVGRNEEDYHQALVRWFVEKSIDHQSKPIYPLTMYGKTVHQLVPDFVVQDEITVELKSIPRGCGGRERVQLFNYLKFRRDPVGLLVNMGLDRVRCERMVHEEAPVQMHEDWSYWRGAISGRDREVGILTRAALWDIYLEHTSGYGDEILQKLIWAALAHHGLKFEPSPVAKSRYRNVVLRESPLDCLFIENLIVLSFTALFDNNKFNINRGRSYLKALGVRWGIAANFGKSMVEIKAISQR